MMKLLALSLLLTPLIFGQCKLIINPVTGIMDCIGSSAAPSGAAGGSLAGTYPNPTIATLSQDLLFTDASYDIGKTGATRPRDIFLSRNLTAGGDIISTGSIIGGSGSGVGGVLDLAQGTLPSLGITAISLMAPTSVTSYGLKYPGAAPAANQALLWGAPSSSISTAVFTTMLLGATNLTTAGAIPYISASGTLQQDQTAGGQLFWDATNHRLGIGTNTPSFMLDVQANTNGNTGIIRNVNSSSGTIAIAGLYMQNNSSNFAELFKTSSGYSTYKNIAANDVGFYNSSGAGNFSILNDYTSGGFSVAVGGSATAQFTLASNGSGTFTGVVTLLNLKRGAGSPESAVVGAVGDLYQRTDGGANTSLYVKESGSGNTGWIAK